MWLAMQQRSLYVLGAGTSVPTIALSSAERVLAEVVNQGIWDGQPHDPSPLTAAMLPRKLHHDLDALRSDTISLNEFVRHTPNSVIEAYIARAMTTTALERPTQYAVFDFFVPSTIFNFNTDSLDTWIHPKHDVLLPHGSIAPAFVHAPFVTAAIRHLALPAEFSDWLDHHRPLPEPLDITTRDPYRCLIHDFGSAHLNVIVGYSFGEQRDSGAIHDTESFELIIDLMRWKPRPTLIVDPYPERIADRIGAAVHRHVTVLPCKWNVLSHFILEGAYQSAWRERQRKGNGFITSQYRRFEEALGA
ncbi:MAG TPA: hypothetical protein VGN07_16045 [Steroidobacteraceae bacterium]